MRQIIAMGGGGFSMEPENLALDRYVLEQTHKSNPKVCFVPTASGDADSYILNFYKSFATLPSQPNYLSIFKPPSADLEGFILEQDAIYVGGGSTRSLMALWREFSLDKYLFKACQAGTVLTGITPGRIVGSKIAAPIRFLEIFRHYPVWVICPGVFVRIMMVKWRDDRRITG